MNAETSSLAVVLGISRGVILHVDDLGMCHSANEAFLRLHGRQLVTTGSIMVPCPWFREIAEAAAADQTIDVGVHLTLTSEWEHYRWGPISTTSRASGLIDDDGYFWRDVASLRRHLVFDAAEAELRAQIERAQRTGVRLTHIDAHMGTAMLPELLACHIGLAMEYQLVPVLPKRIHFAPDQRAYDQAVAGLEAGGFPLPDEFRGTLAVPADQAEPAYRALIAKLPKGVTHMALHCSVPGDIETIAPQHAAWRLQELALFKTGAIRDWCAEGQIEILGYRAIQQAWFKQDEC